MSFENRINYKPYEFKFDNSTTLFIKSKEEVSRINKTLKEESPELDYTSYSWYLTDETMEMLKAQKLKIVNQISWHGGLPFYRVQKIGTSEPTYGIAEFYMEEYKDNFNDSSKKSLQ